MNKIDPYRLILFNNLMNDYCFLLTIKLFLFF
jgi:hypothetical protein